MRGEPENQLATNLVSRYLHERALAKLGYTSPRSTLSKETAEVLAFIHYEFTKYPNFQT